MKLIFQNGLLFTTLKITYRGNTKTIDRVVIDTGATHSIISTDEVKELGIEIEKDDRVVTSMGVGGGNQFAFQKQISKVEFKAFRLKNVNVDFGMIDPRRNNKRVIRIGFVNGGWSGLGFKKYGYV